MCSCDQSLVIVTFLWEKLLQPQFYKDLTRKTAFFKGWSWFKFNNLGLALGTNLKFYTSLSKGLKLKVRKFWGLIPTFVEVTGENLVRGPFCHPPPPLPSWIGAFGQKKWVFDNHMKILNLNFKEKKYSQGYNLKGCSLLFYPKLCVGMSLGFRKKNTNQFTG